MSDPQTTAQWQEAADIAYGARILVAAREWGLISGGPIVDAERCQEILELAAERGVTPSHDAVARFAVAHSSGIGID